MTATLDAPGASRSATSLNAPSMSNAAARARAGTSTARRSCDRRERVAAPGREDVLRREPDPDDVQDVCRRPLISADELSPGAELVGVREPFAHHDLVAPSGSARRPRRMCTRLSRGGPSAEARPCVRWPGRGTGDVERDVEDRAGSPRRRRPASCDSRSASARGARSRRRRRRRSATSRSIELRADERIVACANEPTKRGRAACDDQRDGHDLAPHRGTRSRSSLRSSVLTSGAPRATAAARCRSTCDDAAVGEPEHAVGHPGDRRVVRDQTAVVVPSSRLIRAITSRTTLPVS